VADRTLSAVERPAAALTDEAPPLSAYFPLVARHLRLVAAVTLAAAVITAALVWNTPLTYRAAARLLVTPARSPNFGPADMPAALASVRLLLEGQQLAQHVVSAHGLDKPPLNLTVADLRRGVMTVQLLRDTHVIEVAITLPDARQAADVVNKTTRQAVAWWRTLADGQSETTKEALTTQLEASRQQLEKADEALRGFIHANRPEIAKAQATEYLEFRRKLEDVDRELAAERARQNALEKELAAEERIRDAPTSKRPQIQGGYLLRDEALNPYMNPVYEELSREASLSRAKLAALERQRQDLAALVKTDGTSSPVERYYTLNLAHERLQGDQGLAKTTFEATASTFSQANLQALVRTAGLQVLDEALVPGEPLPRYRLQKIAGAAGLAFIMASLLSITLELIGVRGRSAA
jgi:uncharacterized protein involved in exopolysaccharide biosynthesis